MSDERRLILHMSMSLDGFLAHRDGTLHWHGPTDGAVDSGAQRHRMNLELLGQVSSTVYADGSVAQVLRPGARRER